MKKTLLPMVLAATLATSCTTTDAGTDAWNPNVRVVRLRHTTAQDMAVTLSRFLADARESGDDYPTVHRAAGNDEALVIQGDEKHIRQVLGLIAQLDVEKPK